MHNVSPGLKSHLQIRCFFCLIPQIPEAIYFHHLYHTFMSFSPVPAYGLEEGELSRLTLCHRSYFMWSRFLLLFRPKFPFFRSRLNSAVNIQTLFETITDQTPSSSQIQIRFRSH